LPAFIRNESDAKFGLFSPLRGGDDSCVMSTLSPAKKGYAMPAEWERHEATWISWPNRDGLSFPNAYDRVIPTFVKMVGALVESEPVRINIRDGEQEREVRALLNGAGAVEFVHVATNEPWCRDHGAIFLTRKQAPKLAAVDFGFNAWGWKLSAFEEDDEAATAMANHLGVPVFDCGDFVFEGGSIDVNGAGAVLTT
jgi:agmatine deiminase